MNRLDSLREKVKALYDAKQPQRDPWAEWMYDNHVAVVAAEAKRLAAPKQADAELAEAAALLHDIADVRMPRADQEHEQVSLDIARQLLKEAGYAPQEIAVVVDDAIQFHSCSNGQRPKSPEGLVLAAADSIAHFTTDFYVHALWAKQGSSLLSALPLAGFKDWVLKRLERGMHEKISFDDVREEMRPHYELLKNLFSR